MTESQHLGHRKMLGLDIFDDFNLFFLKIIPTFYHLGQNCYCTKWNNCNWSKEAYDTAKDLPIDNESYKEIQQAFQNYACGNSEEHTVFCCNPNERQPGILFFSTFLFAVSAGK